MQPATSASSPNQQPSFSISTHLPHCAPWLCCSHREAARLSVHCRPCVTGPPLSWYCQVSRRGCQLEPGWISQPAGSPQGGLYGNYSPCTGPRRRGESQCYRPVAMHDMYVATCSTARIYCGGGFSLCGHYEVV